MLRFLCSTALCLLLATPAAAQLASQTGLVGNVTDAGGGVLPGATVTAVNVGTQATLAGVTNEAGVYQFNAVPLGRYEITITLQGFQTFKATNIEVGGNQVVRQDAVLSVGELSETVTVEAANTTLQTDRAAVSQTVEARAVVDLPSSGRNVWQLAATTPGVLRGNTTDIGLSFRGAGQREIQNSLTMDGINATSNLLAMTSMRPMADAVTEVQVQTGSTSAEYGSYLGVHVNVVTKAGTNDFHGSLFEYFQDDSLESRGYFDNLNLPEPPKRSNQFGVAVRRPGDDSRPLQRPQQDVLHGRLRGAALRADDQPDCLGADRADASRRLRPDHHADRQPVSPRCRTRATRSRSRSSRTRRSGCCSTTRCRTCRARRTAPATTIRRRR